MELWKKWTCEKKLIIEDFLWKICDCRRNEIVEEIKLWDLHCVKDTGSTTSDPVLNSLFNQRGRWGKKFDASQPQSPTLGSVSPKF